MKTSVSSYFSSPSSFTSFSSPLSWSVEQEIDPTEAVMQLSYLIANWKWSNLHQAQLDVNDLLYGTLAAFKHPVSDTPAISSSTLPCHIDMAGYVDTSEAMTHTHTHTHIYTIQTTQTKGCDKVSKQRYLASGSRVLRGWLGKNTVTDLVCVCVLSLCRFLATVRDSGLRTITDITHDSHITTQGHYIQTTGLMIARCTVEGV